MSAEHTPCPDAWPDGSVWRDRPDTAPPHVIPSSCERLVTIGDKPYPGAFTPAADNDPLDRNGAAPRVIGSDTFDPNALDQAPPTEPLGARTAGPEWFPADR